MIGRAVEVGLVSALWLALLWAGWYANTTPRRQPLVHAAPAPWVAHVAQHGSWPAPICPSDLPPRGERRTVPAFEIIERLRAERMSCQH